MECFYPENFTNPLQDLLMFWTTLVSLGAIFPIGAFIYGMLSNVRTLAKSYGALQPPAPRSLLHRRHHPPRADRALGKRGGLGRSQPVTSYGAMRDYTFGMGLEDEARDTVQFILSAQPSDAHALGMWTAIRNYMEEGSWSIRPTPCSLRWASP
jgi:hypothetical protein